MTWWVLLILLADAFTIGLFVGVRIIGGWRQLRADLLRIDREHMAVKQELARLDAEWDAR